MVLGEEHPDEGEIIIRKGAVIAHLEQHDPWTLDEGILDFMMRHTGAEHWQCARTLARFGFREDQLEEPIEAFSGGYRMRIKLACMLVQEPDFLMLDEPTNYLDLNTQLILENFLNTFRGGYMVISHDREFIKRTTDNTLEVADGGLFLFPGPLEDYFEFVAEEKERKAREARNVEARRKHLQAFVDRFGAKASKATQAQSRVKQLEKLKPIEIKNKVSNVRMKVPDVAISRGLILTTDRLNCGYGDISILENIDIKIPAGEKFAIVGENGQGKTTFLKTLSGELEPVNGSYRWTPEKKIGYYAQHVNETLREGESVMEALTRFAPPNTAKQELLAMAGSFLFRDEDLKKKIKVLSGGERSRLIIAGLLLGRYDVLLLDEPTNHLDFETVEALGDGLARYQGTVFFVSHDRTFVKTLATSILEVEAGQVRNYPGNYDDYVYALETSFHEGSKKSGQKDAGEKGKGKGSAKSAAVSGGKLNRALSTDHSDKGRPSSGSAEAAADSDAAGAATSGSAKGSPEKKSTSGSSNSGGANSEAKASGKDPSPEIKNATSDTKAGSARRNGQSAADSSSGISVAKDRNAPSVSANLSSADLKKAIRKQRIVVRDAEQAMEKLTREKEQLEISLSQNYSKDDSDKLQKVQSNLEQAEQIWIKAAEELGALES
tara:strand:- start:766 stop:2757 length:1992 start_codon:yes stop_codon:yes gene_type:complete